MSDELPPLPDAARALLARVEAPEPPQGAEDRVFQKLAVSIAAGAAAGAAGAVAGTSATTTATAGAGAAASTGTAAAAGIGAKLVVVIAAGSVAAGLAGGTMLGRTVLAPPPVVVEKVKTVEKVVEVPVEVPAPAPPAPAPPPEPPKKRDVDTALARERELVDAARSALMKGDVGAALASLETHGKQFARGRLAEERESLLVQALVRAGRVPDARARAADFHRKYPKSLLGPTIDAALPP